MDAEDSRTIDTNAYNFEEAKLVASIRWLVTKVYENADIPDRLQQLFVRDQETLRLSPTLSAILTDGSFYTQAASKILHDSSLVTRSLGSVLKELSNVADVEVRDFDGSLVTEEMLVSTPLHLIAHLSLIDALMAAHTKSIISIERVVQAVSVYTSVEKREEPLDSIDAILFWINKVCLLVRDDVERQEIPLKGSESGVDLTIPARRSYMKILCDGTCICALLAFYRPDVVDIRDPISISDCRFNLELLKNFCQNFLPWNPFHFEIEDILVLHESLQPNINAFLADLFNFFEPPPALSPAASATSPTQRRFVQIQGIPDLRAQNIASRPLHPPKTNRNSYGSSQRDRTMSLVSSDSMISADSLRYSSAKPSNIPAGAATTNFGNLNTEGTNRGDSNGHGSNLKAYTEMRLAFEEKRRDHERKLALNSALKEEERLKLGKNAFFKLMSNKNPSPGSNSNEQSTLDQPQRYEGASTARELELTAQLEDIREELKNLKVMQEQQKSMSNLANVGISHATSQPSLYNDLYTQQQQQSFPPQMPNQYGTLPHKSSMFYGAAPNADPMASARAGYGMPPFVGSQPNQTFFPPHIPDNTQNLYAMPNVQAGMPPPYPGQNNQPYYPQNYPLQPSNSHGALHLAHQQSMQQSPFQPHQMATMQNPYPMFNQSQPNPMSYSMFEPHQMNGEMLSPPMMANMNQMADPYSMQQQASTPNSFRLHQPYATSSRLDPSLELNRNLTNWGMTYRVEDRPQRKTWATVESSDASAGQTPTTTNQQSSAQTNGHAETGLSQNNVNEELQNANHHQTPPKDPDLRSPQQHNTQQTPTSTTFPVSTSTHELSKNSSGLVITDDSEERTTEMEARRQALLLSQMKRKEKINSFKEEKKNELDERRDEEQRKQDMAEQRKLERELKRQKLLEDYKRKKMEQELGESMGGSVSARASMSSTGSLNRGHSQPPYSRPKSQSNMSALQIQTMQRPNRTKSSVADENSAPRINVPALADPALKLYAKHQPKSNRSLILNALQYSIFPGQVSTDQRNKVQGALAQSNSKHFLILFRDQRTQYRGLYTWDQQSDTIYRIDGTGPKVINEEMISLMFKYDSGNKFFNSIPTKHLSATIDGFCINEQFWAKAKIPHSRGV
ncbi:Patronin [Aphelenchoides bicaudatus]|nr:Patronin [Aphelenchoides bicaudatus]